VTLLKADGWLASFEEKTNDKTYIFREEVLLWDKDEYGHVHGLCNNGEGFYNPENTSNFKGYREDENYITQYLVATPGWWYVDTLSDGGWWWTRITLWGVSAHSSNLHAITNPDSNGIGDISRASKDVAFIYDPSRLLEGVGPNPETFLIAPIGEQT
jgi:hypothetical protein